MAKVRWGGLSTAKISTEKVLPALQQGEHCEVVGVASRSLESAQKAAEPLGIPKTYGFYEAMLADPEIDAVYNPLPNDLHVPWSIKALEAGKHVLCEKPIGMDWQDGQKLVDAAQQYPNLKVMEAFMYRHHPQWQKARELVRDGKIGELRTIQSFFSYFNADANNIRNKPENGGGGLYDIGCYTISYPRFIFEAEPKRVCGLVEYDPQFKTDRLTSGMLEFEKGSATFTCSTQLENYQRTHILGTEGRIEIEIPCNAPPDRPCKIWLQRGGDIEEIVFKICNQYTIQGDLFSLAILNDTPVPTPIEDSVANMKVIDAIIRSSQSGHWEQP